MKTGQKYNERKQFFRQFENICHASVMLKNLPVRCVVKYCLKASFLRYVREIADVNFTFLTLHKALTTSEKMNDN